MGPLSHILVHIPIVILQHFGGWRAEDQRLAELSVRVYPGFCQADVHTRMWKMERTCLHFCFLLSSTVLLVSLSASVVTEITMFPGLVSVPFCWWISAEFIWSWSQQSWQQLMAEKGANLASLGVISRSSIKSLLL